MGDHESSTEHEQSVRTTETECDSYDQDDQLDLSEEIVDSGEKKRSAERLSDENGPPRRTPPRPQNWEPFKHAPEQVRERFAGQLARAHREPLIAIKLNCIECMGYSEAEPKRCQSTSCTFYGFNRWIFARDHNESRKGIV